MSQMLLRGLPLYNGKGRIIDRTALRRLNFKEHVLDVKTSDGFIIRVEPNDLIGRHIFLTGRFDRCVVDALVKLSRPGACLWDIGANIGYVSCAFLSRAPGSHVIAVEPLSDIASLLRHNLAQFGAQRYAVIEAAVSDRVGDGSIIRVADNSGRSHVGESGAGSPIRFVDSGALLEAGPPPDLIKIDVEGHESSVLRGILPAIDRFRPALVVFEHHTGGGVPDPWIVSEFTRIGYEVQRIWRRWDGWRLGPSMAAYGNGYEASADFAAIPATSAIR
jgi:FkbM family methyltransferase